jgi:beta-lactam-binding protein with PASTA domain
MGSRATGKIDLLKHLGLSIVALVLIVLFVFYVYLPFSTNHGESLTVPNIEGVMLDELGEYLEERDLRYEIDPDSGFSSKYPPLAVLRQFPLAGSKVKEGRKIYLMLNAKVPPVVKLPSGLIKRSLKNAQLELRSLGLALGEIKYKPDFALNTILAQYYKGSEIKGGEEIPKGSKIDFEVGDGLGNQTIQMYDLANLDLEEAIFVIRGYGLKLGDVFYEKEGTYIKETEDSDGEIVQEEINVSMGRIFKQSPSSKRKVNIGKEIDLWIVEVDSAQLNVTPILDDVTK